MRKTIFSFTLAALAVIVLASCGKSNNVEGEKVMQTGYSVVCPTGWAHEETGQDNYRNMEMTKMMSGQVAKLTFHAYQRIADTPVETMKKICREKNGWEYQADKELEDNVWSVAYAPNCKSKYAARYAVFTALKNGVLSVHLENVDINDTEVQQILGSVEVRE